MADFQPGWYPDPDDATARRYWDGAAWSAPIPHERPAEEPVLEAELATPPVRSYKACAVGPCDQPRALDSMFCTTHSRAERGLSRTTSAYTAGAAASNSRIQCPHCGVSGKVSSRQEKVKRGVSGGKATGAVLTGGLSLFATGLSRKQHVTRLSCRNCGVSWTVE